MITQVLSTTSTTSLSWQPWFAGGLAPAGSPLVDERGCPWIGHLVSGYWAPARDLQRLRTEAAILGVMNEVSLPERIQVLDYLGLVESWASAYDRDVVETEARLGSAASEEPYDNAYFEAMELQKALP